MPNPKAALELTAENRMQKAFVQAEAQLKGLDKFAKDAATTMKALGGVFVASQLVRGAKAFADVADRAKQLQNQLKLVTDSTTELHSVQEKLFHLSQDTRSSFEASVELYSRVTRATEQLGLSEERRLALTRAISEAVQVSGASQEASTAALIQLSQGLVSGTLRGEELNSVLEQTPRLAQAIADGMGITIGQLRQFGAQGKLTAEAITKAIESQATTIDAEFQQMDGTVGQASTRLGNSLLRFVGKVDEATSASKIMAAGMNVAADAIDAMGGAAERHVRSLEALRREAESLEKITRSPGLLNFLSPEAFTLALQRNEDIQQQLNPEGVKTSFDSLVSVYQNFQRAIDEGKKKSDAAKLASLQEITVNRFGIQGPDFDEALARDQQQREREAAIKRQLDTELEQVRQFTLTREQVELEAHQRRLEILRNAFDSGLIDQQRYYDASVELARKTQERISQVELQGHAERGGFFQSAAADQIQQIIALSGQLLALKTDDQKKQFELQKKAAIANAVINTARAVTEVLPNFPLAALVAAKGALEIAVIKNQKFDGGGGSASLGGGGGAAPALPPPPIQSPQRSDARNQVVVNVNVAGSVLGEGGRERLAEDIAGLLQEHVDHRDGVIISPSSRQAAIIRRD